MAEKKLSVTSIESNVNNECVFCLENLNKYDNAEISCGHIFHYKCIQDWVTKTHNPNKLCPLCNDNGEIVNIIDKTINQNLDINSNYQNLDINSNYQNLDINTNTTNQMLNTTNFVSQTNTSFYNNNDTEPIYVQVHRPYVYELNNQNQNNHNNHNNQNQNNNQNQEPEEVCCCTIL